MESKLILKPFISKDATEHFMVKSKIFGGCLLGALLLLTLMSYHLANPTEASDEPSKETYNISSETPHRVFYLNILIPPDASVESCNLTGYSQSINSINFTYVGCLSLRCYRFAQVLVATETPNSLPITINVSLTVNRNTVAYVPCTGDELADKIMQTIPLSPSASVFSPPLAFANLEHNQTWRGYSALPVNKNADFSLAQEKVDYLIIGSIFSFEALYDLMVFKSERGLNVYFMATQDIEAKYIGGSMQAKTLEFLKDAYNTWQMRYVLFVGNSTLPMIPYTVYNMPGGSNNPSTTDYYYSTLEQPASAYSYNYSSHHWISDFPDFVLGRFPFDDAEQITNLVNKTIAYEKDINPGDWARRTLIAKDSSAGGGYECDQHTVGRPKDELVYPGNLSIASFIDEIDNGAGSVVVIAHGTPTRFLFGDNSFTANETNMLNNTRLPVFFMVSCHTGKFDGDFARFGPEEGDQSIAVSLLAKKDAGGVAMVSGTNYTPYGDLVYLSVYNYGNTSAYELPNANYEVGKAFYYFAVLDHVDYMILLGDPALKMATANYDLPPSPPPTSAPTPTLRPVPSPTPTPAPSATSSSQSQSGSSSSGQLQPKPNPSSTPTSEPTAAPSSTSDASPNPTDKTSQDSASISVIIVAVVTGAAVSVAIATSVFKKRR